MTTFSGQGCIVGAGFIVGVGTSFTPSSQPGYTIERPIRPGGNHNRWGTVKRDAYARTHKRMRSGAVDAGVRSHAMNEAPHFKPTPPRKILQPRAKLSRPSEQWTEPKGPRT